MSAIDLQLPAPRRRRFALEALSWLAIVAPFLPFLLGLPHFGALERNDYWGDFHDVVDPDGSLTHDPFRWLTAQSNEHPIGSLLPIWLLNARLTGGDNRALALLSFALLVVGFGLLYRRLPPEVRQRPGLLWLLVALYGLAAAFGTAIGRGNYREGIAADTSRYATLQNLVWLGAGMSWALLLRFAPPARPRLCAAWLVLGVATAALVGSNYRIGWDRLEKHLAKVRWQPVAAIAMRWQIDDPQILETVSPRLPWLELPLFRRLRHIPFDRWPEGEPGTRRTDAIDSTVDPVASGQWLALQKLPGAHDRVVGSFARAVPRDSLVLFLDAGGILRGAAAATTPRVGVASTLLGRVDGALEWTGYLDRRFASTVRPHLALAAGGPLLPLAGAPAGVAPPRKRSDPSGL